MRFENNPPEAAGADTAAPPPAPNKALVAFGGVGLALAVMVAEELGVENGFPKTDEAAGFSEVDVLACCAKSENS